MCCNVEAIVAPAISCYVLRQSLSTRSQENCEFLTPTPNSCRDRIGGRHEHGLQFVPGVCSHVFSKRFTLTSQFRSSCRLRRLTWYSQGKHKRQISLFADRQFADPQSSFLDCHDSASVKRLDGTIQYHRHPLNHVVGASVLETEHPRRLQRGRRTAPRFHRSPSRR